MSSRTRLAGHLLVGGVDEVCLDKSVGGYRVREPVVNPGDSDRQDRQQDQGGRGPEAQPAIAAEPPDRAEFAHPRLRRQRDRRGRPYVLTHRGQSLLVLTADRFKVRAGGEGAWGQLPAEMVPMDALVRPRTLSTTRGFMKALVAADDRVLEGAHVTTSTHRVRQAGGSNGSAKYCVSRMTLPSRNSIMLTVLTRCPS